MKQQIESKLEFDMYSLSSRAVDLFVDKIVVHENRFQWKINCISNITSLDNPSSELGKLFAKLVITPDDVRRYNMKLNQLKRVCQKENILIEIYV